MTTTDFKHALGGKKEFNITIRGRRSGKLITTPVWFVQEGDMLYLLPVSGSDTNWFKNIQRDPVMKLSIGKSQVTVKAKPVKEEKLVKEIVERFRVKYGKGEISKWYSKLDVGVEISLSIG